MMKKSLNTRSLSAITLASMLAACGGGGDGGGGAADPLIGGTDVPVTATTSASAATGFVRLVVNSAAQDKEALTVGDVVLAITDTEEPEPV